MDPLLHAKVKVEQEEAAARAAPLQGMQKGDAASLSYAALAAARHTRNQQLMASIFEAPLSAVPSTGLSSEEESAAHKLGKDEAAVAKAVKEFAALETTSEADRAVLNALLSSHAQLCEGNSTETDRIDAKKKEGEKATTGFYRKMQELKRCRTTADLKAWQQTPSSELAAKKAKSEPEEEAVADGDVSKGGAYLAKVGLQQLLANKETAARRREDLETAGARCFSAEESVVLVQL